MAYEQTLVNYSNFCNESEERGWWSELAICHVIIINMLNKFEGM